MAINWFTNDITWLIVGSFMILVVILIREIFSSNENENISKQKI